MGTFDGVYGTHSGLNRLPLSFKDGRFFLFWQDLVQVGGDFIQKNLYRPGFVPGLVFNDP